MYNNNSYILPEYTFISGNRQTISIDPNYLSLSFIGDTIDCYITEGNEFMDSNWLSSESGVMVPDSRMTYKVNTDGDYYGKTYYWDGSFYREFRIILTMENYSSQFQSSLNLSYDCILQNGKITATLPCEDTLNLYGKFLYQITCVFDNATHYLDCISKQGTITIMRNIAVSDLADFFNMETKSNGDEYEIVFEDYDAYIVGAVAFANDWLSLEEGGAPLSPEYYVNYHVQSDEYTGIYNWDGEEYVVIPEV